MTIHDWTCVPAGPLHHFHLSWVTHLNELMNCGLLPGGYYAISERHFGETFADLMTIHGEKENQCDSAALIENRLIAIPTSPPRVQRKMVAESLESLRKTIAIRRVSNHRVVALIEIISPANKDRATAIEDFTSKVWSALSRGVHVLVVDLFPPSNTNVNGIHGEIWKRYDAETYVMPDSMPLTLVSYAVNEVVEAYIKHAKIGDSLTKMPLFLDRNRYVNLPLESTYLTAWRGVPAVWQNVILGNSTEQ